jgi:hypothetical protein
VGSSFQVSVIINSGDQDVHAADIYVSYDPEILTVDSVEEGTFFGTFIRRTGEEGMINFSGTVELVDEGILIPSGKGLVATITFTPAKSTQSTDIQIDAKTVIASGGTNILDTNSLAPLTLSIIEE